MDCILFFERIVIIKNCINHIYITTSMFVNNIVMR